MLISAVILIVIALGALSGFTASGTATLRQREYAQAVALAQRDLEELRAQPSANLTALSNTTQATAIPKTVGTTTYSIWHTGSFVSTTGVSSCSATGTAAANYVVLQSFVSYGQPGNESQTHPVIASTIVNPPNGDNLVVRVTDATTNAPTVGVPISVYDNTAGAAAGTGTTDINGCAVFANMADDSFTVTANNPGQDLTTTNSSPASTTVSVLAGTGGTAAMTYAPYGTIAVSYTAKDPHSLQTITALGDSFVAKAGSNAATIYSTSGTPQSPATGGTQTPASITPAAFQTLSTPVDTLVPFAYTSPSNVTTGTPYTVYPGGCTADAPADSSAQSVNLVPLASHANASAALVLSPLEVTTKLSGTATDPTYMSLTDTGCSTVRRYTLAGVAVQGQLTSASPAAADDHYAVGDWVMFIPQGTYSVCASYQVGTTNVWYSATATKAITNATGTGTTPLPIAVTTTTHTTTNPCP